MDTTNHRPLWRLLPLAVALLALSRSLFTGLEIDEQYALSLSYRLLRGDALFESMWEPHQLSSLPLVPVLALFMAVTGGTAGILLFVRAVTLLCKVGLSFVFYRAVRPRLGEPVAFWAALVLLVYTPKWFLGPDYISQQFHFTVAAFLCLWLYYSGRPAGWAALGAVCACFSFLAFPQSIFAAPVYFIGMLVLDRQRGGKGAWVFLGSCVVCGLAFVAFVLRGLPLSRLISRAMMILNDPQYNFTTGERLARLAAQAADVAKMLAKPALLSAVFTVGLCWRSRRRFFETWLHGFALWSVVYCLASALMDRSMDMRQYLPVLVLLGGWTFWADRKQDNRRTRSLLFWLGWLPGVAAYLMILRSTLLGLAPTFMYLMWAAVCGVLAICLRADSPETALHVHKLCHALLVLVFLFVVVCRVCLIMTTGWKPHAAWDTPLRQVTSGPAAGIWMDEREADRQDALALALEPFAGKQLLESIGEAEGLAYLMNDGTMTVGQASVISGTDSDPRFIAYYEELPEKLPDVVLYDRNDNRDLAEFHRWIEENLPIARRYDVTVGTAELEVLVVKP